MRQQEVTGGADMWPKTVVSLMQEVKSPGSHQLLVSRELWMESLPTFTIFSSFCSTEHSTSGSPRHQR